MVQIGKIPSKQEGAVSSSTFVDPGLRGRYALGLTSFWPEADEYEHREAGILHWNLRIISSHIGVLQAPMLSTVNVPQVGIWRCQGRAQPPPQGQTRSGICDQMRLDSDQMRQQTNSRGCKADATGKKLKPARVVVLIHGPNPPVLSAQESDDFSFARRFWRQDQTF